VLLLSFGFQYAEGGKIVLHLLECGERCLPVTGDGGIVVRCSLGSYSAAASRVKERL